MTGNSTPSVDWESLDREPVTADGLLLTSLSDSLQAIPEERRPLVLTPEEIVNLWERPECRAGSKTFARQLQRICGIESLRGYLEQTEMSPQGMRTLRQALSQRAVSGKQQALEAVKAEVRESLDATRLTERYPVSETRTNTQSGSHTQHRPGVEKTPRTWDIDPAIDTYTTSGVEHSLSTTHNVPPPIPKELADKLRAAVEEASPSNRHDSAFERDLNPVLWAFAQLERGNSSKMQRASGRPEAQCKPMADQVTNALMKKLVEDFLKTYQITHYRIGQ